MAGSWGGRAVVTLLVGLLVSSLSRTFNSSLSAETIQTLTFRLHFNNTISLTYWDRIESLENILCLLCWSWSWSWCWHSDRRQWGHWGGEIQSWLGRNDSLGGDQDWPLGGPAPLPLSILLLPLLLHHEFLPVPQLDNNLPDPLALPWLQLLPPALPRSRRRSNQNIRLFRLSSLLIS